MKIETKIMDDNGNPVITPILCLTYDPRIEVEMK